MPVVSEMRHPRSLNFANERKVVMLRDVQGESFQTISEKVVNLQGEHPSKTMVANVHHEFSKRLARRKFKYHRCGRKPWKVSKEVTVFLLKHLKSLRKKAICTTTMLQAELAREKGVELATSTISKFLTRSGYRWLPRAQKRKYSQEDMTKRLTFAQKYAIMKPSQLKRSIAMAIDGIVLSTPPADEAERANWCAQGETHMWRKRSEAASPDLAGDAMYGKQVPIERAIPMWGGITHKGFAILCFHPNKKITAQEWQKVVAKGNLARAIKSMSPLKLHGPWPILADNESFLRAKNVRASYSEENLKVVPAMPPRSPDLNPIEKFWAWFRRALRHMDLMDLKNKKKPLGKMAYKARIRSLARSAKAQRVAASCFLGLRKVCQEVVKKRGAASRG